MSEPTSEMVEAGFAMLTVSGLADEYLEADKLVVAEIYLAMRAADPERKALVDALEPFADLAEWIAKNRPDYDDDNMEVQIEGWPYTLSVGWLRRARTALRNITGGDDDE